MYTFCAVTNGDETFVRVSTSECPNQYAKQLSILCAIGRKRQRGENVKERCKEVWQCEEWEEKIMARMWEECGEDRERVRAHIVRDRQQRKPLGCGCQSAVMGFVALTSSPASSALRSALWLSASSYPLSVQDRFGIATLVKWYLEKKSDCYLQDCIHWFKVEEHCTFYF